MDITLADCSSCNKYIITTCNANGIRDDSWHVDFDGTYIGDVNITTDNTYADIMIPSYFSMDSLHASLYPGCASVLSRFDSSYLDTVTFPGSHVLKFTCYALNGANNFFTINAIKIKSFGGVVSSAGVVQNLGTISGTYAINDVVNVNVTIGLC
jgi:hypothetical protein